MGPDGVSLTGQSFSSETKRERESRGRQAANSLDGPEAAAGRLKPLYVGRPLKHVSCRVTPPKPLLYADSKRIEFQEMLGSYFLFSGNVFTKLLLLPRGTSATT